MKNNLLKIIFINIILFIVIFFIADDLIYRTDLSKRDWLTAKGYIFFNPRIYELNLDKYGREDYSRVNENISNSVVLFGGSFAYGQNLNYNQTFGYKLSKILKKSVINRAILAGSFQHMYYQSTKSKFYKIIPDADTAVYIMIDDHIRRMLVYTFYLNLNNFYLHYCEKNGKLTMDNYKNPYLNFLKSLYIVKLINHKYVENYIKNEKNADEITDLVILYFIKTRENMEKHFGHKIDFNVVIYGYVKYENILKEKLKKNGFNVIDIKEFKNGAENQKNMAQKDGHPSEEAWNYFTPLIAEKLLIQSD